MSITKEELLKYAYYRCTPVVYMEYDAEQGFPLYRFLASMIMGGYALSIQDIEGILDLTDPEKCPDKFFPFLYESFGLEYFPDIDIKYHRRFLANYGELNRRRGTYSCVKFLVRVLTSLESELRYFRGENEKGEYGRHLIVTLKVSSSEDILNLDLTFGVISDFLALFLPYYITVGMASEVVPQDLILPVYRANASTYQYRYDLVPGNRLKFFRSTGNIVVSDYYYNLTPFHVQFPGHNLINHTSRGSIVCSVSDYTIVP